MENSELNGYCTESVITTIAYIIRKDYSKFKLLEIIDALCSKMFILPCTSKNIKSALKKNPTDFEDGLLYEIALSNGMDYFATSNIKDFKSIKRNDLPVLDAKTLK